jgi:hypothetical protein
MSIGLQVRLNGTPIRGRIDGLDSFSVTYSRNESTGRTQKAFSNELTFYDDGFNLIFNQLVASPTGLTKYIKVQIWDECCNDFIYQDLIIRGSMVKYCTGDCYVEATMIRQDPDERIYDCFDRTPITTDLENPDGSFNPNHWLVNSNSGINIPQIEYCNDTKPGFLVDIVMIITTLLFFVVGILGQILNALIGQNNPITALSNAIQQIILGCGRKHPSARIVDYIAEGAKYCQCDQAQPFSSSFLTNPNSFYSSTLYFYAPIKPGLRNPQRFIIENRPRQTITEFLDAVARDFNALWWVENGRVYMERKDYFLSAPVLYDAIVNQKTGNILKGACFTYNEGTVYASQRITPADDMSEGCGTNSMALYSGNFDYIKIHSQPQGSESWKGTKDVRLSYAPTRFGNDQNPPSTLNRINQGVLNGLWQAIWGTSINSYLDLPVIQKDEFAIPKYYEWDNQNLSRAMPRYEQIILINTQTGQNVPTSFRQANPRYVITYQNNNIQNTSNIYKDFHAIDDPINNPWRFWDYELEVKMDCAMIKQLTVNKSVRLQTPYGTTVQAKINTIVANYGERIITITGQF